MIPRLFKKKERVKFRDVLQFKHLFILIDSHLFVVSSATTMRTQLQWHNRDLYSKLVYKYDRSV